MCCDSWGRKELDTTEQLNCVTLHTNYIYYYNALRKMERDNQIFELIEQEHQRQLKGIELIASENFVSDQVMEAMGSYLTNKYAEGYPGHRYYGGCQVVDKVDDWHQTGGQMDCRLVGTSQFPLARSGTATDVRLDARYCSGNTGNRDYRLPDGHL